MKEIELTQKNLNRLQIEEMFIYKNPIVMPLDKSFA